MAGSTTQFEAGDRPLREGMYDDRRGADPDRAQLFRTMGQLCAQVADMCDDEQIAQYDDVLCQLADIVEIEARMDVARLLAPLGRAPASVVVKLANDVIEVARPLLEFSAVLSDDDLIDIITLQSEDHRVSIASRAGINERVGGALVDHGKTASIVRLVRNEKVRFDRKTLNRLVERATQDAEIAADLRGRSDIDWKALRADIEQVAEKALEEIAGTERPVDPVASGRVNMLVYTRIRNRAGFNAQDWKVAYNQVRGLADRGKLHTRALARFARFGYGHHAAAAIAVMREVPPEVIVRWLASQDYVAIIVALRAAGLTPDLFGAIAATLPWRDLPDETDRRMLASRFGALDAADARQIFDLWRSQSFRRRIMAEEHRGNTGFPLTA